MANFALFLELYAALADPSMKAGGITIDQGKVGNILRNHRPSTDKGILADGMTTDNSGIGANGGPLFNQGRLKFVSSRYVAAGTDDIGEGAGRTAKNVVFQSHSLKYRHIVLYLHVVPYPNPLAHETVLSDNAIPADSYAGHNVREMPYFRLLTNLAWLLNQAGLVDKKTFIIRYRDNPPLLPKGLLAMSEDFQDLETFAPFCFGLFPRLDTLNEITALYL